MQLFGSITILGFVYFLCMPIDFKKGGKKTEEDKNHEALGSGSDVSLPAGRCSVLSRTAL